MKNAAGILQVASGKVLLAASRQDDESNRGPINVAGTLLRTVTNHPNSSVGRVELPSGGIGTPWPQPSGKLPETPCPGFGEIG